MGKNNEYKCKRLYAKYVDKGYVLQKRLHTFDVKKSKIFHIEIDQKEIYPNITREIIVSVESDTPLDNLFDILDKTEKLLMLLEGRFIRLEFIKFYDSNKTNSEELDLLAEDLLHRRLNYYSSAVFCKSPINNLIKFESVLSTQMFKKWEDLLNELNLSYQLFLYLLSDNKMTIDINCAFLIGMSESFIELLHQKKEFLELNPGKTGCTLKKCLIGLITKYGIEIFKNELEELPKMKENNFYQIFVNTRNNIMHTKRNSKEPYLNGPQCLLYTQKFILLYRKILFDFLEIDNDQYTNSLERSLIYINSRKYDKQSNKTILDEFIYNLTKQ